MNDVQVRQSSDVAIPIFEIVLSSAFGRWGGMAMPSFTLSYAIFQGSWNNGPHVMKKMKTSSDNDLEKCVNKFIEMVVEDMRCLEQNSDVYLCIGKAQQISGSKWNNIYKKSVGIDRHQIKTDRDLHMLKQAIKILFLKDRVGALVVHKCKKFIPEWEDNYVSIS